MLYSPLLIEVHWVLCSSVCSTWFIVYEHNFMFSFVEKTKKNHFFGFATISRIKLGTSLVQSTLVTAKFQLAYYITELPPTFV